MEILNFNQQLILQRFHEYFPDNEACVKHLTRLRWHRDIVCPYCDSNNTGTHNTYTPQRFQCLNCHKAFSITVRTFFHGTHVALHHWYLLILYMQLLSPATMAAHSHHLLGLRRNTVQKMRKRLATSLEQKDRLLVSLFEEIEDLIREVAPSS